MSKTQRTYPEGGVLGLKVGQVLDGRFEVGTLIGYGGQGVVLNVRHLAWGRNLALKLPLPEVVRSRVNRDRFLREAETWIRLGAHPNIVRCWFVHKVSGLPGLFLDLITGGSLDEQMKSGKIGPGHWGPILKTLIQVAEGLTHSHAMGVVHRDIKPENILIRENGQVVLTDFGLVKPIDSKADDQDDETQASQTSAAVTGMSQFVGTPRYGAPEQWDKEKTIGPFTDIYALGVVFYELLCGRRPFDAPGQNVDPLELIHRHVHTQAPDPRIFYSDVPPELATLALSCLEKEPDKRPSTAEEVIEHFTQLLPKFGEPTHQRPEALVGGERADLLNNAGVSLYSLGKSELARELFLRGLVLESGHPKCLYNSVQLERREGAISAEESLRRLSQAKAPYELSLLCIEEGLGERARDLLKSIPAEQKSGLVHRSEGDALMYAKQYQEARDAYRLARGEMPFDKPTKLRLGLAEAGCRTLDGNIYFPSPDSVYQGKLPNPDTWMLLSEDSQNMYFLNPQHLEVWDIKEGSTERFSRGEEAGKVLQAWLLPQRLLCQEQEHFESWNLETFQRESRVRGHILALSSGSHKYLSLTEEGLHLYEQGQPESSRVNFAPALQGQGRPRACFTADGQGLCLISGQGKVAQLSDGYEAAPVGWPPQLDSPQTIRGTQLSRDGKLYVCWQSGVVEGHDFETQQVCLTAEVPFEPLSMQLSGELLIFNGAQQFLVMRRSGECLLSGPGPCVLDAGSRLAILWLEGQLNLYELQPFRRLRTWSERLDQPARLSIAADGRRCLSVGPDGSWRVWELDERRRVYERQLLLTPGASYKQLVESRRAFDDLLSQAHRLHQKKQYYLAYRSVLNARAELGFLQNEQALKLQWTLTSKLCRSNLESLWERFYSPDIVSTDLSKDQQSLLLAQSDRWLIRELGERGGGVRVSSDSKAPIVCARFANFKGHESVLVIHKDGTMCRFDSMSGVVLEEKDLGFGSLRKVMCQRDFLFLISERFTLAFLDWSKLKVRASQSLEEIGLLSAYPLGSQRVLLTFPDQGPAVMELKKGRLRPGLPVQSPPEGELTVAGEHEGLFYAGFSDGTLLFGKGSDKKPLLSLKHGNEVLTAVSLNLPLAVGVTGNAAGALTLFDLGTGEVFERFKAHSGAIESVVLSEDGRYFSTRSVGGESRLWELSWNLTDEAGSPTIDWLTVTTLEKLGKVFKRFGLS